MTAASRRPQLWQGLVTVSADSSFTFPGHEFYSSLEPRSVDRLIFGASDLSGGMAAFPIQNQQPLSGPHPVPLVSMRPGGPLETLQALRVCETCSQTRAVSGRLFQSSHCATQLVSFLKRTQRITNRGKLFLRGANWFQKLYFRPQAVWVETRAGKHFPLIKAMSISRTVKYIELILPHLGISEYDLQLGRDLPFTCLRRREGHGVLWVMWCLPAV